MISINNDEVKQLTENVSTGSNFRHKDFYMDIPSTVGKHTKVISFDYDINIIRGVSYDLQNLQDDIVNMTIGNNDIVGVLTANANIGDSTFNVSKTVTDNTDVGFEIFINGVSLGEIVSKTEDFDLNIFTITTKQAITTNELSNSLIGFSYKMVENKRYYGTNGVFVIEGSEMKSFLPKGQKIYVELVTNKTTARVLPIIFEYLFGTENE